MMTTFRVPQPKARSAPVRAGRIFAPQAKREKVGYINGQVPRSREEWRVAVALWTLHVPFDYQVSFFGGVTQPGGFVVDFIAYPGGPPVPIEVIGAYWHQDTDEEEYRRAVLEQRIGAQIRYIPETELQTQEQANAAVRAVLE